MLEEKKEKLHEIIEKLEETKKKDSSKWKQIIEENEEEFTKIKEQIKLKQNELRDLITRKNVMLMNNEEFEKKVDEIQEELSELEMKIYNLRLKR